MKQDQETNKELASILIQRLVIDTASNILVETSQFLDGLET